jgi:hypothetical protein
MMALEGLESEDGKEANRAWHSLVVTAEASLAISRKQLASDMTINHMP